MSSGLQALFFGIAIAIFVLAFLISLVKAPPENRFVELDFTAAGLAVAFFVFFMLALDAA